MTNVADIERLEHERCNVLSTGDADRLAAFLSSDLVHIHANGAVHSKTEYLASLTNLAFPRIALTDIRIRQDGDVFILTSNVDQDVLVKASGVTNTIHGMATRVWRIEDSQPRLWHFQMTTIAKPAGG